MGLRDLFGHGMIRPKIGDRVMHVNTKKLGTVLGRATIHGSVKVPALTVQYDDGTVATQVPEKEFIAMGKAKKLPSSQGTKPRQIEGTTAKIGICLECRRPENECKCSGGPWLPQE